MSMHIEKTSSIVLAARQFSMKLAPAFLALLLTGFATPTRAASYYPQRLEDPKAVYLAAADGDNTIALQKAIDQVQETTGQGIVMLAPGRYHITDTLYIWPGIRLMGYGAERPIIDLATNTPGFGDAARE